MAEENQNSEEYFCTECGAVVNKEDKICPKCGADLSEVIDLTENQDESEKVEEAVVKIFTNEIEAELAKEQLLADGIKCFIVGDNYGALPSLNLSVGFKLIVNEYNLERAIEILKGMDMF
jgi:hypothetical protein